MLEVMRDAKADQKRRDAMAIAAAPYLHPKLSTIDAKLNGVAQTPERISSIQVSFVRPRHTNDDDEGEARHDGIPTTFGARPRNRRQ
jgi:hypothetical protein